MASKKFKREKWIGMKSELLVSIISVNDVQRRSNSPPTGFM